MSLHVLVCLIGSAYGEDAANGVPPADLAAILGHPAPGATAENGEQSSALPAGCVYVCCVNVFFVPF